MGLFVVETPNEIINTFNQDIDHCLGPINDCYITIEAGGKKHGFVNYSAFSTQLNLQTISPKKLNYYLTPEYCESL